MTLSPAARTALTHYPWPGNIRELDNVLSRAVVLSPSDVIEPEFLALTTDEAAGRGTAIIVFVILVPATRGTSAIAAGRGTAEHALPYMNLTYHESMEAHSAHIIERALDRAAGNQTKAAEFLDLQRTYLARLIKQRKPTAGE